MSQKHLNLAGKGGVFYLSTEIIPKEARMNIARALRVSACLITVTSAGMLFGCAHYDVNTAQTLSPAKPAPAPVVQPSPPPPVPSDNLTVAPNSITQGDAATLKWTSENATSCNIQPSIGPVRTEGSMAISPTETTTFTLTCDGAGGLAKSAARITVVAPAPVVAPKPVAKLCSPTVIGIQFDTNKADIKPQYHDELKTLADFLKEFPNAKGTIEGHTDNVGAKNLNMKLSQRRSESVRDYLIKNFGIAPQRISATGFGPTKPVADNATKAGKQQNRRIETNFTCD
ncbi:MAG: OmpA family protein [Geobacter sp.]|nr:MAG: OmpA family protein [Geobacter sp.]